jgi:hypothetical protein
MAEAMLCFKAQVFQRPVELEQYSRKIELT